MSRLAPQVHEENRQAFNNHMAAAEHKQKVEEWLKANPCIGALNGGKYYKFVSGEMVSVEEFGE